MEGHFDYSIRSLVLFESDTTDLKTLLIGSIIGLAVGLSIGIVIGLLLEAQCTTVCI